MSFRGLFPSLLSLTALTAVCLPSASIAETADTWRWINLADWHAAEKHVQVWEKSAKGLKTKGWGEKGFASREAYQDAMRDADVALISRIKNEYGGELMVIPGDTQNGHWERPAFRASMRSVYPDLSDEEVVRKASHLCYGGLRNAFAEAGYRTMLVAVGDHEIGDNPWKVNSAVSKMVPAFRAGHADVFNEEPVRHPENPGNPRLWTYERNGATSNRQFDKSIGAAPSRPMGTTYEETSFAWQYKNVLFITMDAFRQDNVKTALGEEGSVTGDVEGAHLEWFKSVLSEAAKDDSIKHIVVQSHLPIIYPVRKYASSGMLMDGDMDSDFWQAMRDGNVDLYLAGEVHSNTVSLDPKSDIVQWVARGNGATNFSTVDVSDDKIVVQAWKNKDRHDLSEDILLGELVIDKSKGSDAVITSNGLLKAINPNGLNLHYTFDAQIQPETILTGVAPPFVNKVSCDYAFENTGEFSSEYTAWANKTSTTDGVIGGAVTLSPGKSVLGLSSIGPLSHGHARTIGMWVRSDSSKRQILMNTASFWGKREFFNLSIHKDRFELTLDDERYKSVRSATLTDGAWHHVAVTVPHDGATLKETKMYIDGVLQTGQVSMKGGSSVINTAQANWMGLGILLKASSYKLDKVLGMVPLDGALDDFALWTRALSDAELAAVVSGAARGDNAADLERVFSVGAF